MGCNHSRASRPHVFKASNLNENDKTVRTVFLQVQNSAITVQTRGGKLMASWPMQCIRRYGFNDDGVLFIEAGNGCDTGHGMYLFKCERNEEVFELLKKSWAELQDEHAAMLRSSLPMTTIPIHNTALPPIRPQDYVNNSPTGQGPYMNGDVRPPLPTPTNKTPLRGSTSSQHTGHLPSLPEDSPLISDRPFPLQPAPASRKEMIIRRRINSELPSASYQRSTERAAVQVRPNSADYQNNDLSLRVSYKKNTDEVTMSRHPEATETSSAPRSATAMSPGLRSAEASNSSIRSDCELLLTPGSKTSAGPPPPRPPFQPSDPWRRRPMYKRSGLATCGPQSARDYVNTTNASLDVAATPLPATAIGALHFSFDFDNLPRRTVSAGPERTAVNYVPVDCGASSTSSGITGTPRSPKTPLLVTTEYTEIDHNKTRALSHAGSHRARQRVKRHANTELDVINAL